MATFDLSQWTEVPKAWKDGDGFSKEVLEKVFPSAPGSQKDRAMLWRALDNNGNGKVSLAEFDDFVNKIAGTFERKHGVKLIDGKSNLWKYARPCLIRAFQLANGIAADSNDDYVTRSEFRCLLLATQLALEIYRIFDIADKSNDRRVSRKEFHLQLTKINQQLAHYGASPVSDGDFEKMDADQGGLVLLDEAVHFFLTKLTSDPSLLKENDA